MRRSAVPIHQSSSDSTSPCFLAPHGSLYRPTAGRQSRNCCLMRFCSPKSSFQSVTELRTMELSRDVIYAVNYSMWQLRNPTIRRIELAAYPWRIAARTSCVLLVQYSIFVGCMDGLFCYSETIRLSTFEVSSWHSCCEFHVAFYVNRKLYLSFICL